MFIFFYLCALLSVTLTISVDTAGLCVRSIITYCLVSGVSLYARLECMESMFGYILQTPTPNVWPLPEITTVLSHWYSCYPAVMGSVWTSVQVLIILHNALNSAREMIIYCIKNL